MTEKTRAWRVHSPPGPVPTGPLRRERGEHHLHVRTVSSAPAGAPRVLTGPAVDRGTGAVVLHAD
ncbi:hypothetical protein [Amycolatopsis sp. NPDC051903]|uniref:hypothetical protein n=1 Tax=Amycolatopsis sp. NPDC051903 TaxID=3363936 RepID=UPI0037B40C32